MRKKRKTLKNMTEEERAAYYRVKQQIRDWEDEHSPRLNQNIPLVVAVVTLLLTFRNEITWLIMHIVS